MSACCPTCGSRYAIWTPAQIIEAAHRFKAEHGRFPLTGDWAASSPWHPTCNTVYRHFGTWDGFRTACGETTEKNPWTRETTLAAIYEWKFEHGRLPTGADWLSAGERHPSKRRVRTLFGSWNGAIIAAGYDVTVTYRSERSYRASMAAVTKRAASTTASSARPQVPHPVNERLGAQISGESRAPRQKEG